MTAIAAREREVVSWEVPDRLVATSAVYALETDPWVVYPFKAGG